MKLKTLKDLEDATYGEYDNEECVTKTRLKQEAIKWLKFMNKNLGSYPLGISTFIVFFNITEEDLK